MLKIRRIARYTDAKYPRGPYHPYRRGVPASLATRGAATLFLLALYEACDGTGVTGPPPVVPDLVTESEARSIITSVFDRNGIALDEDIRLVLQMGPADSAVLDIDGYSDSLRVGYEYISPEDRATFTGEVLDSLLRAEITAGPYIKAVDAVEKEPGDDSYIQRLESTIEAFIDSLKANGVI